MKPILTQSEIEFKVEEQGTIVIHYCKSWEQDKESEWSPLWGYTGWKRKIRVARIEYLNKN